MSIQDKLQLAIKILNVIEKLINFILDNVITK